MMLQSGKEVKIARSGLYARCSKIVQPKVLKELLVCYFPHYALIKCI